MVQYQSTLISEISATVRREFCEARVHILASKPPVGESWMQGPWQPGDPCRDCGQGHLTYDEENGEYACDDCGVVEPWDAFQNDASPPNSPEETNSNTVKLPYRLRKTEDRAKKHQRKIDAEDGQIFFEDNIQKEMESLADCDGTDDRIKFAKHLWINMKKMRVEKRRKIGPTRGGKSKQTNSSTRNGRAKWKHAIIAFVLLKTHALDNRSVQEQKESKRRSFNAKIDSPQMKRYCEEIKQLNEQNSFRERGLFNDVPDTNILKELSKYCKRVNQYLSPHAYEGRSSGDGGQTNEQFQALFSRSNETERNRFLEVFFFGCQYVDINPPDLLLGGRLFDQLLDHTGYSNGATTPDAKLRCYVELVYQFLKSRPSPGAQKRITRGALAKHITASLDGSARELGGLNKYMKAAKDVLRVIENEGDET